MVELSPRMGARRFRHADWQALVGGPNPDHFSVQGRGRRATQEEVNEAERMLIDFGVLKEMDRVEVGPRLPGSTARHFFPREDVPPGRGLHD